jgi:hypothetical protein
MGNLGPLQFDGCVRAQEKNKSFDLMVRASTPLDSTISEGIRTIFSNSMEVTGMRGKVVFQYGQQHFVRPQAESARNLRGGANTILA